ncbi:MAG: DUF2922 family protein [Methanocorpusculum sp.]|nr:DUF2922 family protein [Methanocorpusculum sp.]
MAKTRTLYMIFQNQTGKESKISVQNAAAFISSDDVEESMDTMIQYPCFAPALTAKKQAYVQEVEKTELFKSA